MSLYSKYRPQNFANLVGQEHVRQTILHEIQKGSVAHAYLFAGPRGTGKTSSARLIAKALNCEKRNAEGEPCDTCSMCIAIKDGSLIDVIEIDAASNRGIDEIRDLKEKIQFAPTRAKSKTYIIDEIHMLTKEAFNALLKTLEEPPENVYFILCTTEVHKIPETIISRCQRFDFKRIDLRTIMTRLNYIAQMEKIEAEPEATELIARNVEGGLRDAIGLFEQMSISGKLTAEHVRTHLGITGHATVVALLEVLEQRDIGKALHLVSEVHREGYDSTSFIREILECLRQRLVASVQGAPQKTTDILLMIERFEEARDMLRNTVIPELPLEIAVIKICGVAAASVPAVPVAPAKEHKPVETAPIAMPEATHESQKAEEHTATKLKQEFETEQYQGEPSQGEVPTSGGFGLSKHWPRILENLQPPSLRRSVSDATVAENQASNTTEASAVTLTFSSRFHIEKVNTAEHRSKIEAIVEKLFNRKVKVVCVLDTAAPAKVTEVAPEKPKKRQVEAKKPDANVAEQAMEIFGEE